MKTIISVFKKIISYSIVSLALNFPLQQLAVASEISFESAMQGVLSRFSMTMGQQEKASLIGTVEVTGQKCQVLVYNESSLNGPFRTPEDQFLQVTLAVENNYSNFRLDRTSNLISFQELSNPQFSDWKLLLSNFTGVGNNRMNQSIQLRKMSGPSKQLSVAVMDFGRQVLQCTLY